MSKKIPISGVCQITPDSWSVDTEDHIPLSVCADGILTGPKKYLEVREKSASLEFSISPGFMEIWDISVVKMDSIHHPAKSTSEIPKINGLPIIGIKKEKFEKSPYTFPYFCFSCEFSTGVGEDFFEIDLGCIKQATHIIASGPLEFYVDGAMIFKEKDYGDDPWDTRRIAQADLLEFYVQPVSLCGLRVTGLQEKQMDTLREYHFYPKT